MTPPEDHSERPATADHKKPSAAKKPARGAVPRSAKSTAAAKGASGKPTGRPTAKPTGKPSGKPTGKPFGKPDKPYRSADGKPSAGSRGQAQGRPSTTGGSAAGSRSGSPDRDRRPSASAPPSTRAPRSGDSRGSAPRSDDRKPPASPASRPWQPREDRPSRGSSPDRSARPRTDRPVGGSAGDRRSTGRPTTGSRPPASRPRADTAARGRPYEEDRRPRPYEPELPAGADMADLDEDLLRELNGLPAGLGERVGAHLAAVAYYLDDEPEVAHQHAVFARSLATRLAGVREIVGVTGYLNGHYSDALADLRAARRITGRSDMLPMIADCERGLGRPERALAVWDDPQVARLDVATRIELLIVVAGARRDMGQDESAAVMLQVPELHRTVDQPWCARLRYAYADVLAALGRTAEARRWFTAAAEVDGDELTDAQERLAELA